MKVKVKRAWRLQTLKQKESEEKRKNSNDTPHHGYTGVVTRVNRWENFLTVTSLVYLWSKIENWGCTVMHRDIELNRIDDMIIVIETNRKSSIGSHP